MLLRSMKATPATKNDVKNISDNLDKIYKSLVDNSSSPLQLTEEIKELRSQQFLSEQYEDMKQRLHSKDEEVRVFQAENQDLKLHVCKLEAVTSQTHEEVNDLLQMPWVLKTDLEWEHWRSSSSCLKNGGGGLKSGRDQCLSQTVSCLR